MQYALRVMLVITLHTLVPANRQQDGQHGGSE
jgi:hypothetical protein